MTSFGWVDGIVIDRWTILRGAKKEDALNVAVKMKNEFNQAFVLFMVYRDRRCVYFYNKFSIIEPKKSI